MDEIRKLREALGWSKAELARRAKMHASDVGKIEAGRVVAYDSQLRRLAKALGVNAETLRPATSTEAGAQ